MIVYFLEVELSVKFGVPLISGSDSRVPDDCEFDNLTISLSVLPPVPEPKLIIGCCCV